MRRLRKDIDRAIGRLRFDELRTMEQLIDAVSVSYGKPIVLEALPEGGWGALTAFLDEDARQVTIYYRLQDSPQYRLQCICHELGHLMMGTDCALPIDDAVTSQVEFGGGSIRVQARDLRDTQEERAAEEFAFAVIRKLRWIPREPSRAGEVFGW